MADDLQDNTENPVENLTEDSEEREIFEKITISQLQQKYSIGRGSLYERMKFLKITTYKDEDEKAYLSPEQVGYMDGLHQHIKEHGRMKGFSVPEPSGPEAVELPQEEEEETGTLVVAQTQKISKAPSYLPTQTRKRSVSQVENLPTIVQSGQNKAAGHLIAENTIARGYIENPELLPEELKQKIREAGEVPVIDPFAYAESLMSSIRAEGLIGSI